MFILNLIIGEMNVPAGKPGSDRNIGEMNFLIGKTDSGTNIGEMNVPAGKPGHKNY